VERDIGTLLLWGIAHDDDVQIEEKRGDDFGFGISQVLKTILSY
jgi:hypothetical protein